MSSSFSASEIDNRTITKPGTSAVALFFESIIINNLEYNQSYTQQIDNYTWVTPSTLSGVVSIGYSFVDSDENPVDWLSF